MPEDRRTREQAAKARAKAQESAESIGTDQEPGQQKRFQPSESLKKLYREVAKRIHPDLANSEKERARRTQLMAEVNRAYEEGDEGRLEAILREWDSSPEAVRGKGPGAELIRAIRKIAQIEERLHSIESEIDQLNETDLFQLKEKVEVAATERRDLLAEMAAALDHEIADARGQLARIERETAET